MKQRLSKPMTPWILSSLAVLALLVGAAAYASNASSTPTQTATQTWTRDDASHLLRRAGFGGTPDQIDKLFAMGKTAAVDYLIDGPTSLTAKAVAEAALPFPAVQLPDFDPKPAVALADQRYDAIKDLVGNGQQPGKGANALAAGDARRAAAKLAEAPQPGQKNATTAPALDPQNNPRLAARIGKAKQKQFETRFVLQSLRPWWIDRMVRSDYPLQEKMTLFWHSILTSGIKEVKNANWLVEQDAMFRREALGNYKHLIHSTVHDAAMLKYLNNDENVKGKPNENLAREMMELFTMGEGDGYTEKDIGEIARALTGLSPSPAGVRVRPYNHDNGTKTIFGHTGNFGPDDVVDLIFAKPQPTEYLAKRLWEFFAYPDPSAADLAPVIAALRDSHCELKPALKAIFTSNAFYSDKAKFALIKSPTELAVETMRNLQTEPSPFAMVGLGNQLRDMGQELFEPPNVRGWVGGEHWITSASLFLRYNVACNLVDGTLSFPRGPAIPAPAGTAATPAPSVERLFASLGQHPTADQVVDAAIARFLQRPLNSEKRTALLNELGSGPIEFGNRESDKRVRQVVDLILSTPEYQVH